MPVTCPAAAAALADAAGLLKRAAAESGPLLLLTASCSTQTTWRPCSGALHKLPCLRHLHCGLPPPLERNAPAPPNPEPADAHWCTRHSTSPPQAPALPRNPHTPRALHWGSPHSTPARCAAGPCASTRCSAQSCHHHQAAGLCGEKHACACARHQLHPLRCCCCCCLRLPLQQPAVLCWCHGLQQPAVLCWCHGLQQAS
jgi:hypothetical protein